MYDIERYYQAKSVQDAIAALSRDPAALVIAGGSDVLVQVREGKLAGCSLVSIHGLEALRGVRMKPDGTIVIGPLTTFAELIENPIVRQFIPALGEAVDQAGGPQLRQVATVGGNVCNGVTSADSAPCLLTLNAELCIEGPGGVRTVPHEAFYDRPGRVHLSHGELLTAIRIRKEDYQGYFGVYVKNAQRSAMDIATLGCAVHLKLTGDRAAISDLRLAFGVAAPTPVRCHKAEQEVRGQAISEALLARIGPLALTELSPRTSFRASKAFREQLILELSKRVVREAIRRARGDVR